jgi:transcriptional repressor NrdR
MRCPYCQGSDSHVVDTRAVGDTIRRRRECPACKQRFTTYERLAPVSLFVAKRDGRREPFDHEKLYNGIYRACAKRPISDDQIQGVVSRVENQLYGLGRAEVDSEVIGQMVMDELRDLDEVAYVRFASVYRRFKDIDGLAQEIKELKKWKRGPGSEGSAASEKTSSR